MSFTNSTKEDEVTQASEETQDDAPMMHYEPILEAQKIHGPIFRRKLFDVAYAAHLAINDDEPEEAYKNQNGRRSMELRTKTILLDIYGNEQEVPVMISGIKNTKEGKAYIGKRFWNYIDLQDLAWRHAFGYGILAPFQFYVRDVPVEDKGGPIEPDYHRQAAEWRAAWEESDFCRNLTTFFTERAGKAIQRIDRIICFGLGSLVSHSHPRAQCRSYVQHLAACMIRDILAKNQAGTKPEIFAQEPEYTSVDIAYLA